MTPKAIPYVERVEAASADDQFRVLMLAFEIIKGPIKVTGANGTVRYNKDWFKFKGMLAAEAYESAALMLIPAGRRMSVQQRRSYEPIWVSFTTDDRPTDYTASGKADTLTLAITAAALRLKESVNA